MPSAAAGELGPDFLAALAHGRPLDRLIASGGQPGRQQTAESEDTVKKALIVWGGWDGHEPKQVTEIFAEQLSKNGFDVEVSDTLDAFKDEAKLKSLDLIVPEWTMGSITGEQLRPVLSAVAGGVGIAGVHGGMGDSFRQSTEWQLMVGGQWVAHPGNDGDELRRPHHRQGPVPSRTASTTSARRAEQYYMHVDPSNQVLATTVFAPNVVMPVAWTRHWGKGRVYYCSLGHVAKTVLEPPVLKLITQGLLWASEKD